MLLLLTLTLAQHPTPAAAGFHHCALIYERDRRSPDDLGLYVADERGWLFDSFLFLSQRAPSGESTMDGRTSRSDWQGILDRWFAPGRDLAALDVAVARAAARLGPPARRRVMLMIPRLHAEAEGFDDPAGQAGQAAATAWYVGEAARRFAQAGFRHLELWGFYWMHETIPPADEPRVAACAQVVHDAGFRLLWIPWYRAVGWDRWRACGIDVAILQPNYAFVTQHGGRIRRNRLTVTAELAAREGLGVEIEVPLATGDPASLRYWRDYLVDGGRLGYQDAATAYYLGSDEVERAAASDNPYQRELLDLLRRYVRGERIGEPPQPAWRATVAGWEADLGGEMPLGELDLFLDEPDPDAAWRGLVSVAADDGRPVGWAIRGGRHELDGRHQALRVPLAGTASRLTVRCEPQPPGDASLLLSAEPSAEWSAHLAVGRPYTSDLAVPARYPDTGGELTDGLVPEGGYAGGGTVGWYGRPVSVAIDLGRPAVIERIEVDCQGGGTAAVHAPADVLALLGETTPPPTRREGLGEAPTGIAQRPAQPPEVLRRRAEDDLDLRLTLPGDPARPARFVTVLLEPLGWLMLQEIRVLSGGVNLAAGLPYVVRPWPTAPDDAAYPDDGAKLTDGVIAGGFSRELVVGWSDGADRAWTVDLGAARPISAVTVWSLGGGLYGIHAPREVSVEVSADGRAWRRLGVAPSPAANGPGGRAEPAAYRLDVLATARFVRVAVAPSRGWAMLSEIVID